jgi:Flp pilus assembly protein TadG
MRRALCRLRRDRGGAVLAEFILVVPLWGLLIFATLQTARVLWGYAGLQNGVAEGARLATLYPRQTDTQIKDRIYAKAFGIVRADISVPILAAGKSGSIDYVDITVDYTARLPLLNVNVMTFRETRRAYRP